jgi:hypothetical protein
MAKQQKEDNILTTAATVVAERPSAAKHAVSKGKLQKKNKSRVPRRQKKFQQKAAARHSAKHPVL